MIIYIKKLNGAIYDISQIIGEIKWSGEKQKAARALDVDVLTIGEIVVKEGDILYLFNDLKKELFRGMVFKKSFSSVHHYSIKAYDTMIYWANNSDSFTFKNKTADKIFTSICQRFKIPIGVTTATHYVIPELNIDNKPLFDVIRQALSITYKHTGRRYYLRDEGGKICLLQRSNNVHNMILETTSNIFNFSHNNSIEDLKNKVKLVYEEPEPKKTSQKGKRKTYSKQSSPDKKKKILTVEKQDNSLIKTFGLFQTYQKISDKINSAQAQQRANELLRQHAKPKTDFTIDVVGIDTILSGDAVIVKIPELKINKTYYVDGDAHTFKNNVHTMSLKLSHTNEL